jgi:hypothetical protein
MKRGTPDHWKMKELARLLDIPPMYTKSWATGCMERLWHYAARYCLQGDIGRVPDTEIAEVVGWPVKGARRLVDALVTARWLDRSSTHRLLIHDWHEHCDEAVKKTLKNRKLPFFFPESSGMIPENSSLARTEALAFPSLSQAKPKPMPAAEPQNPPVIGVEELETAWDRHHHHSRDEPKDLAFRVIFGMNGDFPIDRFRANHALYCESWDGRWQYCSLTFLGYIRAGCPPPPPAEKPKPTQAELRRKQLSRELTGEDG